MIDPNSNVKPFTDTVDRPLLWTVLARLGMHGQMLHAIQSLYAVTQYARKVGGRLGSYQVSIAGLKQGCLLSPTLFGHILDGITRFLQPHCAYAGFRIAPNLLVSHLLYADDILLTADLLVCSQPDCWFISVEQSSRVAGS